MRILEGRLVNNPPILLPSLSVNKVAPPIQIPATKNEMITLMMKVVSISENSSQGIKRIKSIKVCTFASQQI